MRSHAKYLTAWVLKPEPVSPRIKFAQETTIDGVRSIKFYSPRHLPVRALFVLSSCTGEQAKRLAR
jgi:hypothetical protein